MSGRLVALISLKPRVYILKNHDPVGLSPIRSAGILLWSVLIGRTEFDTITSIPDPTLNFKHGRHRFHLHRLALLRATNAR